MNLLARIAAADPATLALIYDRYGREIYSLALNTLKNDSLAAGVVEMVFIALWQCASDGTPLGKPLSVWLLQQTQSQALNMMPQAMPIALPISAHETLASTQTPPQTTTAFLWSLTESAQESEQQHIQ